MGAREKLARHDSGSEQVHRRPLGAARPVSGPYYRANDRAKRLLREAELGTYHTPPGLATGRTSHPHVGAGTT